ncbi:hypothetical protein [Escherichia coli]|uniref:hypothetical protein n=1 Tax=Escherichia coli TaxID=562 RepID=UPI001A178721|nr:hypothetical protein [Escherichia coli]GHM15920.1 hypothetical protein ECZU42_51390 [Escherichia coli]
MVFIRPTILRRDGMAADGVSQRKYNYMRAEQIYRDEQGLSLMPHTQPVLPAQNRGHRRKFARSSMPGERVNGACSTGNHR